MEIALLILHRVKGDNQHDHYKACWGKRELMQMSINYLLMNLPFYLAVCLALKSTSSDIHMTK